MQIRPLTEILFRYVRWSVPEFGFFFSFLKKTKYAVFWGEKFENYIVNNDVMSDYEVITSYVPSRYFLNGNKDVTWMYEGSFVPARFVVIHIMQ